MANFSIIKNKLKVKTPNKISYKRLALSALPAIVFGAAVNVAPVQAATPKVANSHTTVHSSLRTLDPILKPVSLGTVNDSDSIAKHPESPSNSLAPQDKSPFTIPKAQPNPIKLPPLATTVPVVDIVNMTVVPSVPTVTSASFTSASGTSYPWANAPFPNSIPDSWGMYQRQCVSYTAWKVASSGRNMPSWAGRGDANLWDDNARAEGIPVDTIPRAGDIAVDNSGAYGHTSYVESVNSDGTINISQYNVRWDGMYSEETNKSPAGLVFIHFQ